MRLPKLKIAFLSKRHYTNKDLLKDRFGRLFHLPMELKNLGCDVSVVVLDYRSPESEETIVEGLLFKTIPCSKSKLPQAPFLSYFTIKKLAPDIIVASGDSHIGFLGFLIAKHLRSRFVFDVYDYYPAFRGNRLPGFKAMFRKAVSSADLVLCASLPLLKCLASLNARRLLVENGVDRELFKPEDMGLARESLGIPKGAVVIGYFGSINSDRGPLLIEACRELRKEYPDLCLVMAGKVTQVDLAMPWIRYQGELPQDSMPKLIAASDVVVLPYANDPFNSMTGACKLAEYLACEKPVVATRVAGHEATLQDVPMSLCDPTPFDMLNAIRCQLTFRKVAQFPEGLEWKFIGKKLLICLQGLRLD